MSGKLMSMVARRDRAYYLLWSKEMDTIVGTELVSQFTARLAENQESLHRSGVVATEIRGVVSRRVAHPHCQVDEDAKPKFFKSPLCHMGSHRARFRSVGEYGVLEKIKYSEWAAPIVPVPKADSIRICGDYNLLLTPLYR